ncbi:LacI family DNA-binding transcriptional regulator [Oscillospiraceae bacterium PP1C4]
MDVKKVSIVDIAQMANVSIATVSRVLNKTGRYSPETEKKVLELVKEYGYTPNANAKSLRTNKTQSIGVIVPDITNEFFAKIVRSIENSILPYGYSVFVCDSHDNEQIENQHIQNLIAKNVDGVIYISGKVDTAGNEEVHRIPVVYIDRHPENAPTIIQSDNERGGFLATEELILKGCKRIVILQDYCRLSTLRQRHAGYIKAHVKYGVPIIAELQPEDSPGYKNSKDKIIRLLKAGVKFDGVFATNDMMALGALHALTEAKINVPGEVKLVGFDDISLSAFCEIPMTTVTQDTEQIGSLCVQSLVRQMQGEKIGQQNIVVPVSLNVRRTT